MRRVEKAITAEKGLETRVWRRVVIASMFFVLGFTTVFIALGATASALGQFVQELGQRCGFENGAQASVRRRSIAQALEHGLEV